MITPYHSQITSLSSINIEVIPSWNERILEYLFPAWGLHLKCNQARLLSTQSSTHAVHTAVNSASKLETALGRLPPMTTSAALTLPTSNDDGIQEKVTPTPDVESGLPTLVDPSQDIEQDSQLQFEDNSNVPSLSLPRIFWIFLVRFGLFAWGGPVAQIALLKEQLVIKEKWITVARFNRVFAVYQILPGPEAAELCMFFGCLAGGRTGGIAAGLGFILPGFVLMLLASYLYVVVGFGNVYFDASFRALQPMVAAMVSSSIITC